MMFAINESTKLLPGNGSLGGWGNGQYGTAGVVAKRFDDDTAAVAGALRKAAVVAEEEPLSAMLDDGGVGGVGVARYLADDAHGGVGATDVVAHGVGYLLGPL